MLELRKPSGTGVQPWQTSACTHLVKWQLHVERPDGVPQHTRFGLVLDYLELLFEQSLRSRISKRWSCTLLHASDADAMLALVMTRLLHDSQL